MGGVRTYVPHATAIRITPPSIRITPPWRRVDGYEAGIVSSAALPCGTTTV
jgi:hypothetical protein